MKRKRLLNKLLMLREIQYQQVAENLSKEQFKLEREEQRLEQLEHYQQSYAWEEGRETNGFSLNSAQMMVHSVGQAVRHQRQQVAVQQVQCRAIREKVLAEKRQVRTAEMLTDRHQQVLNRRADKMDQKQSDELSSRQFFFGNGW